jgi:putative membrane protein
MGNVLELYRTQIDVLWNWSGGRVALVKRLLITLVVATIAFSATAWLLRSVTVDSVAAAFAAVVLMALFNAVVRVAVLVLIAPFSPVVTGILVLVFQVLAFLLASSVVPGVHLSGVLSALIASLVYAAINTVLTAILGIDQSDSYYGRLMQAMLVRTSAPKTDKPGLVVPPDRWPGTPDHGGPDARRIREHHGRLGARREPQALEVGGDPALDDLGQPGGHPPRHE